MSLVYCVNIENFKDEDKLTDLLIYISKEKVKKLMNYKIFDDRKRGLISELLVRYLIVDKFKMKNDEIILDKNKYGKPFLKNQIGIEYNLSHSGDFVVCAIGNHSVGIDIEHILNIDLSLSEKIFTKEEYKKFQKIEDIYKLDYFYRFWTLKESFIKAKGVGLYMQLDSFNIDVTYENEPYCLYNDDKYYFKEYGINPLYKLSICSMNKDFANEIKMFSFEQFYDLIKKSL